MVYILRVYTPPPPPPPPPPQKKKKKKTPIGLLCAPEVQFPGLLCAPEVQFPYISPKCISISYPHMSTRFTIHVDLFYFAL